MILGFVVDGNPIPKARARVGKGRRFTPTRTKDYEALVKAHARRAVKPGWPMDCTYEIALDFARATADRCDIDNLIKSVLDAMNGVVYDDDWQVSKLAVTKVVDRANPGVTVRVKAVQGE